MGNSIAIVDDHNLFAKSLQNLVNSFEDFETSGLYTNGSAMIQALKESDPKPDVILLDIRMPLMDGPKTMGWLKENYPDQKVMALTMEDDEEVIIQMVKLGCRGYLLKDIEPEDLHFALKQVVEEGFFYSEAVSKAIKHHGRENTIEDLTKRELEFLRLACTDITYKEVANQMNLSPKTVDGYRESLFHKLNVRSRIGLVVFAIKNKLYLI